MAENTATFTIAKSSVTTNLGEKRLGPYSAYCRMTSTITVTITRGYTSPPEVTSSCNLSPATATYVVPGGTWKPSFDGAVGTIVTENARRANEAGFWEKETTTETRTAVITAVNRETGTDLT